MNPIQHLAVMLAPPAPGSCSICGTDDGRPSVICERCGSTSHESCYLASVADAAERAVLYGQDEEAAARHIFLCARCRN